LLYEMLTGRVPVGRFKLPSQLNSEVPPEVDPIVLRCLEAQPQDRYATVGKLLRDVRQLEDQLRLGLVHEVRGIGSQTSRILLRSTGSRALRAAMLGAGVITVVGVAFWIARSRENQPDPSPQARPASDAVEFVQHERFGLEETEIDPLAGVLDDVVAPEVDDSEDEPGGDSEDVVADNSPGSGNESSFRTAPQTTGQPGAGTASEQSQVGLAEDRQGTSNLP
jgi:hypothetical protein